MKIVGIDPGVARIGYALIDGTRDRPLILRCELIEIAPQANTAERLHLVNEEISKRLKNDAPSLVGVEKLFFSKNVKTALMVSEGRGVILAAIAKAGIDVLELAPQAIKIAVTGHGGATKPDIARMLALIFPKHTLPRSDDALDALAIALAAGASHRTSPHTNQNEK